MPSAQQNSPIEQVLSGLNPQQREAATHDENPLLIIAGAGTGKTTTLVHRVAWMISQGIPPQRILLLTFTRRAAGEMLRRVDGVLRRLQAAQGAAGGATAASSRVWGGTFHAIATRLLRRFGKAIGLPSQFAVLDRGDSEDLMAVARAELGLAKTTRRFPQKGTCLDIYSRCVNSRQKLPEILDSSFHWCKEWHDELKKLFDAYVDRKEAAATLDYDDLLLYWQALVADEQAGAAVRKLFDRVLVDEYQDTNVLQAEILHGLCPQGRGLTVVGDDAQSIYSFRAATVRNILDFAGHYPGAALVTLEQNYRSTQPILEATNQIIAQARERYTKNLWSQRSGGEPPLLVTCEDENDQTEFVIRQLLAQREEGVPLRHQAVLFRASHHSMLLEAELTRRNIPFHKYGGLKFVETAHVKDLLAFLRLADNPRDEVSGTRLLLLLPGIGPAKARQLMEQLREAGGDFAVWNAWKPPPATGSLWKGLVSLLSGLAGGDQKLPAQVHRVRSFYGPLLEAHYDNPQPRLRDLEQMELIASRYRSRRRMLLEMALDPPNSTQDLAGPPVQDEDYLVLSTIHSAKGLEWNTVLVIHAADGNIPSDMATGSPQEIEEELRLFYVALTRAKNRLCVCYPLRYYYARMGRNDHHGYAQRTRFISTAVAKHFQVSMAAAALGEEAVEEHPLRLTSEAVRRQAKDLWN